MSRGRRLSGHRRRLQVGHERVELYSPRNIEKFWVDAGGRPNGDDCLIWPLANNGAAGDFVPIGRKRAVSARRYSATISIRPPFKNEIAVVKCGKLLCVNPKHIGWTTRSVRLKKSSADGLMFQPPTIGEANAAAVLDEEKVMFIRQSQKTGKELADMFGVARTTISMAQLGHSWGHLPGARVRRRTGVPYEGYVEINEGLHTKGEG